MRMNVTMILRGVAVTLTLSIISACKDLTAELPAGYVDPETYTTEEAAYRMARQARYEFQRSLMVFMLNSGTIADEFHYMPSSNQQVIGFYDQRVYLDSRYLPDPIREVDIPNISSIPDFNNMQNIRRQSFLARAALGKYGGDSASGVRAEMAVYEAFAEVMLADLYCSGIPLSVIEFEGDFHYRHGSPTRDVYGHAITLFDTAIALAGTDIRLRHVAQIGKGRALLSLGQYRDAANVVAGIPDGYFFDLPLMGITPSATYPNGIDWPRASGVFDLVWRGAIADRKGGNGLDFLNSHDPRIKHQPPVGVSNTGSPIPLEQTRVTIADAMEARLIEVEANLHDGNPEWLSLLNALRTNGSTTVDDSGVVHYGPGIGGVPELPPLQDPILSELPAGKTIKDARVDLLMRERAFWLFFRGIRQGDLRRMIRHYGRSVETLYPQGNYPTGTGYYDQYVDVPIPTGERPNPYFDGCLARGQ